MTAACLSAELLALAASDAATEDPIVEHLADCARCRTLVHAQQATRGALAVLPTPPPLAHHARVELGDLLVASARPHARRDRFALAAACIAGVAVIALVALATYTLWRPSPRETSVAVPAPARPIITPLAPLDTTEPAADRFVIEPFEGASYELDHDRVRLRGGGARIQSPTPIVIELGGTAVTVTGHVELRAPRGVVASVHVFAGSAQIANASRVTTTIIAGETWVRPGAPSVSPSAPSAEPSWFAIGWMAYREGRDAEAIAAFDRVDDPAVAEDAAFWAGHAAERSGDVAGARARFVRFLERFPGSDRADTVRARLTER